jgi:hypothetical protein
MTVVNLKASPPQDPQIAHWSLQDWAKAVVNAETGNIRKHAAKRLEAGILDSRLFVKSKTATPIAREERRHQSDQAFFFEFFAWKTRRYITMLAWASWLYSWRLCGARFGLVSTSLLYLGRRTP